MLMGVLGELLASWRSKKEFYMRGRERDGAGVKLTTTDREDIIGGSLFLLLLAASLFLSAFL